MYKIFRYQKPKSPPPSRIFSVTRKVFNIFFCDTPSMVNQKLRARQKYSELSIDKNHDTPPPPPCTKFYDTRNFQKYLRVALRTFSVLRDKKIDNFLCYPPLWFTQIFAAGRWAAPTLSYSQLVRYLLVFELRKHHFFTRSSLS